MLSLTKKTDYALVALACLAQRAREGAPPVSAGKLADEHSLPAALTANILKDLHLAKIVDSTRGPQGGYALTQSPDKTTLLDVVTAIEGPIRLADCSDDLPILGQSCQIACKCPIRDPMRRLNERLRDFFQSVTLADLFENKLENKVDVSLSSFESNAATRPRKHVHKGESSSPDTPAPAPGWLKVTV
jgi:FeS assembly SUF system regulator